MNVYSVDPGDPFLITLASRLLDGTLWPGGTRPDDPFILAKATIYLPTRRAARALAEAFLTVNGGPTPLPRIEALGEGDEEDAREETQGVIGLLEARVALAQLITAFGRSLEESLEPDQRLLMPTTGADAIRLADDLIALMDQVETQEANWDDLPGLVDSADLTAYWEITTRFLEIATQAWPDYLEAAGKVSAATRRKEDTARAAHAALSADGPIIVAGSTGSIPATRRLIKAIAESPGGAVVLPGFDRSATDADWDALSTAGDPESHAQFGMKQLIDALGISPARVVQLTPADPTPSAAMSARRALWSAALRPAEATHHWPDDRDAIDLDAALSGVSILAAADERTEAAAIALAMREAVEAGERVALITPHRPLARRVSHALARHAMSVDDSGGEPLASTQAGIFARLVAHVALMGGAADWLALLKHPLCLAAPHYNAIAAIEATLRGPRVAPHAMTESLSDAGADANALFSVLRDALAPLADLKGGRAAIGRFAAAHRAAIAAARASVPDAPDSAQLDKALDELERTEGYSIAAADWPSAFEALVGGLVVRVPLEAAAVAILGPLEARLQTFDHAILGGLNEGVWPQMPDAGPWMSRGMMAAFGIDLPERKIGLSAHDAFIAAHAPRLTLSRAKRSGGEPTVASRWLQRLSALSGEAISAPAARGERLLALAAHMEAKPPAPRAIRPCPAPPLAARPDRFSLTDVGLLVRDPYAYYAKRILSLRPLEPLEADPDGGDRGEIIHQVLKTFISEGHHREPDAEARFHALTDTALKAFAHAPEAQALWGARLHRVAPYFVAMEAARAAEWTPILTEAPGEAQIAGVTLHGRIDRVDRGVDGVVEIIDYKTGIPPTQKAVAAGHEPQLPLEAMLLRHGGLAAPADAPLAALSYVKIAGGRTPLEWRRLGTNPKGPSPEDLTTDAETNFAALIAHYAEAANGYLSRARVEFEKADDGDYDHLARTAEWHG